MNGAVGPACCRDGRAAVPGSTPGAQVRRGCPPAAGCRAHAARCAVWAGACPRRRRPPPPRSLPSPAPAAPPPASPAPAAMAQQLSDEQGEPGACASAGGRDGPPPAPDASPRLPTALDVLHNGFSHSVAEFKEAFSLFGEFGDRRLPRGLWQCSERPLLPPAPAADKDGERARSRTGGIAGGGAGGPRGACAACRHQCALHRRQGGQRALRSPSACVVAAHTQSPFLPLSACAQLGLSLACCQWRTR